MRLVEEVYVLTNSYPGEESYGLTSQTLRAAVSVVVNIAEGLGRQYKKDTIQFLYISKDSINELETLLNIGVMIGILEQSKFYGLIPVIDDTIRLLNGFINYMKKANLK